MFDGFPYASSDTINYFRFQEIAGALDSALASPNLVIAQASDDGDVNLPALTLRQSVILLDSLRSCWREDVLVLSCSDKFFRLSLQLLSRFFCGNFLNISVQLQYSM